MSDFARPINLSAPAAGEIRAKSSYGPQRTSGAPTSQYRSGLTRQTISPVDLDRVLKALGSRDGPGPGDPIRPGGASRIMRSAMARSVDNNPVTVSLYAPTSIQRVKKTQQKKTSGSKQAPPHSETTKEKNRRKRDERLRAAKAKQKPKAKAKATKIALATSVGVEQLDQGWDFATGHSGSGQWTDQVKVSGRRSYADERTGQVLRHISMLLFHYVKSKVADEQEVQAMLVHDRLFIGANDPRSMAALRGLPASEWYDILRTSTHVPEGDVRAERAAVKTHALAKSGDRLRGMEFGEVEDERYDVEALQRIVQDVTSDPEQFVHHATLGYAAKLIDSEEHLGHVILVDGMQDAHAEQNLILAYCESGYTGPAMIYGKKRPCTGCLMTFRFAKDVLGKDNLEHSENPGGYWGPALNGLWILMRQQRPNITIGEVDEFVARNLPAMTHRSENPGIEGSRVIRNDDTGGVDTGYGSESDSEAEEDPDPDMDESDDW